jgi:putative membrane-bound dehydrogenase-like protein
MISTMEVADGFTVELFAAEPLVTDPVGMTVDAQGRMYVIELHGYPDDESGASQIKRLSDTDGDGYPDEATVFADDLRMPKGIMNWKDGLLVTDAPDVLYFEDTDGDGQADVRETLLTGFGNSNPQLGVNTPIYGLDNWIYLAHMTSSDVTFGEEGSETYDVSRNVRFRPGTKELEELSAQSQFGQTFNAWGDHFNVRNSNHIYQEVLAAPYVERNPDLLVGSVTEITPDHGASARVYPITPDPNNRLGRPGGITSASGIISYLGGSFPEGYDGVTFVGEPIYNVVHGDRMSKEGPVWRGSRLEEEREFLASTDRWFRPVQFYIGPDGALYVLDYSRRIIEQPRFLTQEILESADLYTGSNRGRIFRIAAEDGSAPDWLEGFDLENASPGELVQAIDDANVWWRRNAQRLLVDQQPEAAIEPLQELVRRGMHPEGRVHALWTLQGMNALEATLIETALEDESVGVRRNAVKLAELALLEGRTAGAGPGDMELVRAEQVGARSAGLIDQLLGMSDDEDPHVRYQVLLTLGYIGGEPAEQVREEMLFDNLESRWMQLAALSAPDVQARALYDRGIATFTEEETPGRRGFFERVSGLIGARGEIEAVQNLIETTAEESSAASVWWRAASLEGLADGLRGTELAGSDVLASDRALLVERFFTVDDRELRTGYLEVLEAVGLPADQDSGKRAARVAADTEATAQRRADAIRLLALADPAAHRSLLERLIDPKVPTSVQREAVQTLGELGPNEVGPFLVDAWAQMTPGVRDVAIRVLLQDDDDREAVFRVFDAIEEGIIRPTAVPRDIDEDLVEHNDERIRERANAVLRQDAGERQEVFEDYRVVLDMEADADRGYQVFNSVCARCHQVDGEGGIAFGPDMAALENRPPQWLLKAIIVPNHAISDGYEQWVVERNDGERLVGIISSETPTSITLKSVNGEETTVARSDIASIEEVQGSAMPAGLEEQITRQQMADLLSYLMSVQTVN